MQPCSDPDRQSVGRSAVDLRQKIKVGKPIRCVRKHLVAADHGEILLAHAQIRAAHQLRKQNDLLREFCQIQYALHHRFPIQIVITAELCVDPDDHTAFLCLFLRVPGQDQTAHLADIIIRARRHQHAGDALGCERVLHIADICNADAAQATAVALAVRLCRCVDKMRRIGIHADADRLHVIHVQLQRTIRLHNGDIVQRVYADSVNIRVVFALRDQKRVDEAGCVDVDIPCQHRPMIHAAHHQLIRLASCVEDAVQLRQTAPQRLCRLIDPLITGHLNSDSFDILKCFG